MLEGLMVMEFSLWRSGGDNPDRGAVLRGRPEGPPRNAGLLPCYSHLDHPAVFHINLPEEEGGLPRVQAHVGFWVPRRH